MIFFLLLSLLFIANISATRRSSFSASSSSLPGGRPGIVGCGTFTRTLKLPRGGATLHNNDDNDEDEDEDEIMKQQKEQEEELQKLRKYKLEQQHLLQLRSTFLSEALAVRGIPVGPTLVDVSTPEGKRKPQDTDWDCCMSTVDDPKSCLYSFDAEPNTKVISPINTKQYISLSALNRLRRSDPTKVEPMWHSQYSILHSWFDDKSPYSLLQHVDFRGFFISSILLDLKSGLILRLMLMGVVGTTIVYTLFLWEYIVGRVLTSKLLWDKWASWGRFVHAALPLKLIMTQMIWRFIGGSYMKLETYVKDYIVELECNILEKSVPLTIYNEGEESDDDYDDDGLEEDSEAEGGEEEYNEEADYDMDEYD